MVSAVCKNNEISLAEAHRLLNSNELEELKWDVQQYIKYGKENAINGGGCRNWKTLPQKHT